MKAWVLFIIIQNKPIYLANMGHPKMRTTRKLITQEVKAFVLQYGVCILMFLLPFQQRANPSEEVQATSKIKINLQLTHSLPSSWWEFVAKYSIKREVSDLLEFILKLHRFRLPIIGVTFGFWTILYIYISTLSLKLKRPYLLMINLITLNTPSVTQTTALSPKSQEICTWCSKFIYSFSVWVPTKINKATQQFSAKRNRLVPYEHNSTNLTNLLYLSLIKSY